MALTTRDITELTASGKEWCSCYSGVNGRCTHEIPKDCKNWSVMFRECSSLRTPPTLITNNIGKWRSDTLLESSFNSLLSSDNIQPGDLLWGGIYIGVYQPSLVTLNDGINTITTTNTRRYAIIVDTNHANLSVFNKSETPAAKSTSVHNGLYNRDLLYQSSLYNTLDRRVNPFSDWYLPSICELKFLQSKASLQKIKSKLSNIIGTRKPSMLLSSSFFNVITGNNLQKSSKTNTNYYSYTLNMNFNSITLLNSNLKENCLFFRRIELI